MSSNSRAPTKSISYVSHCKLLVFHWLTSLLLYQFWLQDSSTRRDEEFVTNLNRTLPDPNIIAIWDMRNVYPASEVSTSAAGTSTPQFSTVWVLLSLQNGGRIICTS
ncbi:hypothetical protein F4604DRAFT_1247549 [Suillus subluteus]|nr:hypothetical protein F4604DRAFT_1247549 [Suillus subluteus]